MSHPTNTSSATSGDDAKLHLIWCFNETDRNTATVPLRGARRGTQISLLSHGAPKTPEDLFRPRLTPRGGYSAKKLNIRDARQLELAIASCREEIAGCLTEEPATILVGCIGPFWYKVAWYNAITRENVWSSSCGVEASTQAAFQGYLSCLETIPPRPGHYLIGKTLSVTRGAKRSPDEFSIYRKIPKPYQYLSQAPWYHLTDAEEVAFEGARPNMAGGAGINWKSFRQAHAFDSEAHPPDDALDFDFS